MKRGVPNARAQLSFMSKLEVEPPRLEHGGDTRRGLRKLARPIDVRRPMHLVLRSLRARGGWSLRRPDVASIVSHTIRRFAERYRIRVYEFANAGNHIHLLVRTKCRFALQNFLRTLAGVLARLITGAQKGRPVGRFWDKIAYSRVVSWGREFFGVRAYVVQNELEARGEIPPRSRKQTRRRKTPLDALRE